MVHGVSDTYSYHSNQFIVCFFFQGRGAYFADDPRKSHGYTEPDNPSTNQRVIFYNKVLLGIESKQTTINKNLTAAPLDHHSVHGMDGWQGFQYHEYIVYRYGQALPYLKITYTA
jgi:hypothetical protein